METRLCRQCDEPRPLTSFVEVRPGQRRRTCTSCRKSADAARNPSRVARERADTARRKRELRQRGDNVVRFILEDSRKSDRKHKRSNDLTREWVAELIAQPCCYCGDTSLRMTLDRIDNTIGHFRSNVVPACIRCNYARGAMPYKAWLCLVPGLRAAREQGLFGDWTGRTR